MVSHRSLVAATMQKKYSTCSGPRGVLKCDAALLAQDKQEREKSSTPDYENFKGGSRSFHS